MHTTSRFFFIGLITFVESYVSVMSTIQVAPQ